MEPPPKIGRRREELDGASRERLTLIRLFEDHGITELAPIKIADFLRIRYGGTNDAKRHLGPVPTIRDAFVGIHGLMYQTHQGFRAPGPCGE